MFTRTQPEAGVLEQLLGAVALRYAVDNDHFNLSGNNGRISFKEYSLSGIAHQHNG
jgi:hypothetical protein